MVLLCLTSLSVLKKMSKGTSSCDTSTDNTAQLPMASQAETSFVQKDASEKSSFYCENLKVGLWEKAHENGV